MTLDEIFMKRPELLQTPLKRSKRRRIGVLQQGDDHGKSLECLRAGCVWTQLRLAAVTNVTQFPESEIVL